MNKQNGKFAETKLQMAVVRRAAVVLAIVLAVVWMSFAVKKVERERDFSAPLPNSAPVR